MTTATTPARIARLGRALLGPRGIADLSSLVATVVKYKSKPGYVMIDRQTGRFGRWFAAPRRTELSREWAVLGFDGDYRRNAGEARRLIARGLEDLLHDADIPDPDEGRSHARTRSSSSSSTISSRRKAPIPGEPPPGKTPAAQLDREIAEALGTPKVSDRVSDNLGMARARRLAEALRGLGDEAEAFRQYGQWNAVGVHRVGPGTAGTWRQIVAFADDGELVPPAGGPSFGTGNPWRHGPRHDAVEEVMRWRG